MIDTAPTTFFCPSHYINIHYTPLNSLLPHKKYFFVFASFLTLFSCCLIQTQPCYRIYAVRHTVSLSLYNYLTVKCYAGLWLVVGVWYSVKMNLLACPLGGACTLGIACVLHKHILSLSTCILFQAVSDSPFYSFCFNIHLKCHALHVFVVFFVTIVVNAL